MQKLVHSFVLIFLFSLTFGQEEISLLLEKEKSIERLITIGEYDSARVIKDEILNSPNSTEGSYWKAVGHFQEGRILKVELDNLNAIENLLIAREIFTSLDSLKRSLDVNHQLFWIYMGQEEFDIAESYCLDGIRFAEEIADTNRLYYWYNSHANLLMRTEDYVLAEKSARTSMHYAQFIEETEKISYPMSTLGEIYYFQEIFDSSTYYYEKSLEIKEQHNMNTAWLKSKIGKLYIARNQPRKAISICREGYEDSKASENKKVLAFNCECLHEASVNAGEYKKGYYYLKELMELKGVDATDAKRNEITRLNYESKYQLQTLVDSLNFIKEKEVSETNLKLKESELSRANAVKIALFIGLGLVLIFAIFLFSRFQIIKKQKALLAERKEEAERLKVEADKHRAIAEERNKEILDSINYAKRIQKAILPTDSVLKKHLPEHFVMYVPKDIVAGDFYWLGESKEGLLIAAADCTGHGVPGAMVSVICNNGLNRSIKEYSLSDPADVLEKTRELVVSEFEKSDESVKDGMDIALCSLAFDSGAEKVSLKYAGANNPLWIIRKGNNEIEEYKPNKQPIGKFENPLPFETHEIELNKGDQFYIFSDGYADQFGGEKGKKFKASNFKKLLLQNSQHPMKEQRLKLIENFENWKGSLEQLDDICVIGLRI